RPAYFLDVPGFRDSRSQLVSRGFGMVVCRAVVLGVLEQESGHSRGPRLLFCHDRDRHPIIPFMPDGWDAAAGFPAMKGNVAFLMKDVVLLAASFYLLKQDVVRVSLPAGELHSWQPAGESRAQEAGQVAANI